MLLLQSKTDHRFSDEIIAKKRTRTPSKTQQALSESALDSGKRKAKQERSYSQSSHVEVFEKACRTWSEEVYSQYR